MPLWLLNWRVWAALALAGALAFSHLTAYRKGKHAVQAEWDEARVEQERATQEQAERNRELSRAAEKRYVVQQDARDRFIVTTVKEISDAAAPLADCRVPDAVRLRLNEARACALGDSSACGSPDGSVPKP